MTRPQIAPPNGNGHGPSAGFGGSPLADLAHGLAPMQEATDPRDLWAGLARSVVDALGADACLISLVDPDGRTLKDVAASVVAPYRLNTVAQHYALSEFPETRAVIETGTAVEVSVRDPDADARERGFLAELGFMRVLMCRLALDDAVGTIEVYRGEDKPFKHDDPKQVEVLVRFAANAYARLRLAAQLESQYTTTIEALVSALEARDPYTEAHTGRIRDMATALGNAMHMSLEGRRALRLGAILHDVGKIGITDSILRKPGPLNSDEWTIMKKHPEIGERMLGGIDFLESALPIIRHHHERWDGGGYPDGLAGEGIPLGARIVAVCDSYDAMTSDRPYRLAMSSRQACDELLSHAGSQFDPACAALLVDLIARLGQDDLADRFVRYAI